MVTGRIKLQRPNGEQLGDSVEQLGNMNIFLQNITEVLKKICTCSIITFSVGILKMEHGMCTRYT